MDETDWSVKPLNTPGSAALQSWWQWSVVDCYEKLLQKSYETYCASNYVIVTEMAGTARAQITHSGKELLEVRVEEEGALDVGYV